MNQNNRSEKKKRMKTSNTYKLWYQSPAKDNYDGWETEALPIGNGDLGAKIFGGVQKEHIQFNEKSLWTGATLGVGENTNGNGKGDFGVSLRHLQDLLKAGKEHNAKESMELLQGDEIGLGAYQNFGDIYINFLGLEESKIGKYQRCLDLETGIANVSFQKGQDWYKREFFASFPDQVMVIRLQGEGLNCDFEILSAQQESTLGHCSQQENIISDEKQKKSIVQHQRRSGIPGENQQQGIPTDQSQQLLLYGKVNGDTGTELQYTAAFHFETDGIIESTDIGVRIKKATIIEVYLNCMTNYGRDYPEYRKDVDIQEESLKKVTSASRLGYSEVRRRHLEDYQELFGRVSLWLGGETSELPTNLLLKNYQEGKSCTKERAYLEELLYQYGRYLLISSSRKNGLPANLQGVWNASNQPPWQSDYHLNINLQMNYWPALVSNLPETVLPLVDYVRESLVIPGRKTAYHYTGVGNGDVTKATGWMAHTQNNIFGHTGPGSDWRWGWDPGAGAFILQNLYDYFRFTRDIFKLEKDIYPMMEEAARMWSQLLIWDEKQKRLVASPCFSPEHGPVTSGATFDQQMVWQLYHDTLDGAKALRKAGMDEILDVDLLTTIEEQIDLLKPYNIGSWGQIKEWFWEDQWEGRGYQNHGVIPDHRHISHLLGLYPGFDPCFLKEEYQQAAITSLLDRGESDSDVATGWSKAHKMAIWARLLDGEQSYNYVEQIITKSTLTNLWNTHPPFQIDGNFGYTAGISEMLLQSHGNVIHLLPALPKAWQKKGGFTGLVARGNIQVDCHWEDGQVVEFTLMPTNDTTCVIHYNEKQEEITFTVKGYYFPL
jgi:alpha-L-fucosidase 2